MNMNSMNIYYLLFILKQRHLRGLNCLKSHSFRGFATNPEWGLTAPPTPQLFMGYALSLCCAKLNCFAYAVRCANCFRPSVFRGATKIFLASLTFFCFLRPCDHIHNIVTNPLDSPALNLYLLDPILAISPVVFLQDCMY